MNTSVLEKNSNYQVDRPYSRKELLNNRHRAFKSLKIGKVLIYHPDCRHSYYAKANGRKEKEAIENSTPQTGNATGGLVYESTGNCSVCWKIGRTPKRLKGDASSLSTAYMNINPEKFDPPESYMYLCLETDFYTWLYNEFNPSKDEGRTTEYTQTI
jgi:hypothetical protein